MFEWYAANYLIVRFKSWERRILYTYIPLRNEMIDYVIVLNHSALYPNTELCEKYLIG